MILHLIMAKARHSLTIVANTYIRILVDSNLNFAFHIKLIENKVARSIGIISKLNHLLPTITLLLLYRTIVRPHLLYGVQIWGNTYPTYLSNLIVLQSRVLRIIGGGKWMKELLNITLNFTF